MITKVHERGSNIMKIPRTIICLVSMFSLSSAMQFKHFYAGIESIDSLGYDRDVKLDFKNDKFRVEIEGKPLEFKEVGADSCSISHYEAYDDRNDFWCILGRFYIASLDEDSITVSSTYQYHNEEHNVGRLNRIENVRISREDVQGFCVGPTKKKKAAFLWGFLIVGTIITGLSVWAQSY